MILCGKCEISSNAGCARLLIRRRRRHGVFNCDAGTVKDDNFFVSYASGFFSTNDFTQLRVNVFFPHQTFGDRVMRIANGATLFQAIGHDFSQSDQRRIDFLFVRIVGADCGDESSRCDIFFAQKKLGRCGAGNTHIAFLNRARQIANDFDVDL
jgi:hypothetical protein